MLHCFNGEEGPLWGSKKADGAPFGKDDTATSLTSLPSKLNRFS